MPWSTWIELPFRPDGTLDRSPLNNVPAKSGVYAIASKKRSGLYVTHYVGRSKRSIRERLQRHLSGHGNSVVSGQLDLKKAIPVAPVSICIAYLETKEPGIVEAVYLDTKDLPICNLIRARLPIGLSEWFVQHSALEH